MRAPSRWLGFLCFERGALLWIPSLWLASALVLFAILQAAAERAFYNHAQDLKVALGPLELGTLSVPEAAAFETGLRQGLAAQRELTLLGAAPVRARAEAVLGTPLPSDARRWIRATRNLNVSYFVTASARPNASTVQGMAELWRVADERRLHAVAARAAGAAGLGRALADSLGAVLFSPRNEPVAGR